VDNRQVSQLTMGMTAVLIGVILLAGQLNVAWSFGRLWPVIFIIVGMSRFLTKDVEGYRGNGGWFLFLGLIFLLHTYRILRMHDSWPLFIVAAGLGMMFGRDPRSKRGPERQRPS